MSKFYQPYTLQDIGMGLNRYHSLDSIPEGMMYELKNMDPQSNGQISTRKGHERYYGGIPLRAKIFQKTGTTYNAEFDSAVSIDLSRAPSGPIIVAGDLPSGDGPYTGDFDTSYNCHYYSSYNLTIREIFLSGAPATKSKPATATGVSQENMFVGWFNADLLSNLTNTELTPEEIIITKSDYNVDLKYTSPSAITGYFAYLETPATTGTIYIHSFTAETTVTILANTMNLINDNYIIRVYEDDGTYLTNVVPTEITTNANGDITITFPSATTGRAIIYATENQFIPEIVAGPQFIEVNEVTEPFNFFSIWATIKGVRTLVTPASISWNSDTLKATIEYVVPDVENVEVYWEPANYVANAIEFTGSAGTDFITTNPEITVWGIPHDNIYKVAAPKGGFTHHIDNYKTETATKVVTALGGNLMQATSYTEGSSTYKMTRLSLRGSNRVSGIHKLAPLFTDSANSRTRGDVVDTSVDADGYARVTAVSYVSNGIADYTFTFDNDMTGTVGLGAEVSTNDKLTVRNCAYNRNNGTFDITNVTVSGNDITFRVENTACIDNSKDESNILAQGNVFTDEILLTGTPNFLVGDKAYSNNTTNNTVIAVDVSAGNHIYIDNITELTNVSDGINLYVSRTSALLPLQNFPTESVGDDTLGGFVIGDSVEITGISNIPNVKYVNPHTTAVVPVNISSGVATVTLTGHKFNVGQTIAFKNSSDPDFEGEYQIVSIPTENTFTLSTTAADGDPTVTMIGKTIELDEELSLVTGPTPVYVTNQGRWTVVENPKSAQSKIPETKIQHWDESTYTDQPYLRSVVVNDSMFFVNSKDEVKKFDGTNLMNAGLYPWQATAFLSVDSATQSLQAGESTTTVNDPSADPSTSGYFHCPISFTKVSERFKSADTNKIYTTTSVDEDKDGNFHVFVRQTGDDPILDTGSSILLRKANRYRYYIRLNAVDANRNIIASAYLGSDDLYIETFTSSAIDIKAIGMPPFEELDHDRIELEIYRTKRNTAGPFYRVHRRLLDYGDNGGYIVHKDTLDDLSLTESLRDVSPIGASGLGNQWNIPPKAGSITTVDSRLVLGNIKSPPTLDITFLNSGSVSSLDIADFSGGEVIIQKSTAESGLEDFNDSIVFSFESSGAVALSSFTIATSDISINQAGHDLSAGDWIYLFHSTIGEDNYLDFAGWYRVSEITDDNNFKVAISHTRAAGLRDANDVDRYIVSSSTSFTSGERVPVWIEEDGNYNQIYEDSASIENRVSTRLSIAISAVMSADNPSNGYWASSSPSPWLLAQGGQSFDTGTLKIELVDEPSGTLYFRWSGISADVEVYANNLVLAASTNAESEIRLFNSRIVTSYPNFPEIFDNPFDDAGESDSVIDVNPADGQEITAMIPFFGQSAFGAANLTQVVVVFKTSSVYLVNISTGQIQKLQSQGQGCTAPRSVSVDKDGVIFANESGLYRLGWDMRISWVGRMIKELWTDDLSLNSIAEFAGHNYKQNRQYKLSVVTDGNSYPSNVLVYDHTREDMGQLGAWSEYTNHAATGWANQAQSSFFGTQDGKVMRIRNTGEPSDYRDDDQPIDTQSIITGGIHFGLPGNRKTVSGITLQYQNGSTISDLDLATEQNLTGTFADSQQIDLSNENNTVRYSLDNRKGNYLRIKIEKSGTKDEKLELSKIIMHVKDIGSDGVKQAREY